MEALKEWGAVAPADSMIETHPNALIVSIKRDPAANAVTGLSDDRTYQAVADFLRELQAIQDRRRHDLTNPGRQEFGESEWISEDTTWPPENLRLIDAGYHLDSLSFHDTSTSLFDATYALPKFMRPKRTVCKEQATGVTVTCFMMVILYCFMHLIN